MALVAASPLPAIAMVLVAVSLFPVSDGIAKHLTATVPLLQIVWARYFFHLVLVLPVALAAHGREALAPRVAGRQMIRGVLLLLSTISFFAGLRHLPIADSVAVLFVAPLVVTVLAPFVLGEAVGIRRYGAAVIGFAGALLIVRPGAGAMEWQAIYPLLAALGYACYLLATRRLAGSAPPVVNLVYTAVAGAVTSSAALPFVWQWPGATDLALMAVIGPLAALGHYMIIRAHERAQASLLAPFSYWQIVSSTTIGYLAFGDFPDRWTWLGIAVVAGSGIYISVREQRLALARARAAGLQ